MNQINQNSTFLWAVLIFIFSVSCSNQEKKAATLNSRSKMAILQETAASVTFQEASGKIVTLPKNPKRTIVALNSILDVWYMAGGTGLARLRGSINVPEEARDLPLIGTITQLNTERIMTLEPDFLVVTGSDYQIKIRDFFLQQGVPGVAISYQTYADFRILLDLFTRLTGRRELYNKVYLAQQQQVQTIIDQVPDSNNPEICILFASTKYVKVETQNTITGDFCQKLGAHNIYQEKKIKGATRVALSLEYIMEQNPDIIFVTTMGDVEKCRARFEKDIISSDIWGELKAVQNNRFFYLDKSFSIYKPNRFYPRAFKIMAGYLYPKQEFVLKEEQNKS